MADDEEIRYPRPDPIPKPPIDDPPDEIESESLNDFIKRLELAADTHKLRVSADHLDEQGNLVLTPVIAYFVDSGGTPHEGFDTSEFLQIEARNALAAPVPTFPGGTMLNYKRKALNDGSNAGNHITKIEPFLDSPFVVDFLVVWNMDSSSRNVSILFDTSGATSATTLIAATSTSAGEAQQWPAAGDVGISRIPVDSRFEITMTNAAVAVAQDTYFFYQFRYWGDTAPNVTETGPTGVTWSDIS